MCGALQSASLTDNQKLDTDLAGQMLTVYLKPAGVVISGVQTAANVTQPNIIASKVASCLQHMPGSVSSALQKFTSFLLIAVIRAKYHFAYSLGNPPLKILKRGALEGPISIVCVCQEHMCTGLMWLSG